MKKPLPPAKSEKFASAKTLNFVGFSPLLGTLQLTHRNRTHRNRGKSCQIVKFFTSGFCHKKYFSQCHRLRPPSLRRSVSPVATNHFLSFRVQTVLRFGILSHETVPCQRSETVGFQSTRVISAVRYDGNLSVETATHCRCYLRVCPYFSRTCAGAIIQAPRR